MPLVPGVEDVEEQAEAIVVPTLASCPPLHHITSQPGEKNLQSNKSKRLQSMVSAAIKAVRPALSSKHDRDQPEVAEDEVEQQRAARAGVEQEAQQEEGDGEDGNDEDINEPVAGPGIRVRLLDEMDLVRRDAEHDHRRDPDQEVAERQDRVEDAATVGVVGAGGGGRRVGGAGTASEGHGDCFGWCFRLRLWFCCCCL